MEQSWGEELQTCQIWALQASFLPVPESPPQWDLQSPHIWDFSIPEGGILLQRLPRPA